MNHTTKNISQMHRFFKYSLLVLFVVSCVSHQQKPDDAYDRFKQKKMLTKDSVVNNKKILQDALKTDVTVVKKKETTDEWALFRIEIERKIHANENKISEMKSIQNASANLLKRVSVLENNNNDLRKQLDEFNEEVKVKWESFKIKMNHDANEIGIELKAIKINNKK